MKRGNKEEKRSYRLQIAYVIVPNYKKPNDNIFCSYITFGSNINKIGTGN